MRHIDELRLETDLQYRFAYLSDVMHFDGTDIEAIHGAAERIGPLVNSLVDAVYEKLFSYNAMKRHFIPPQFGYLGAPAADLESLTLHDDVILFRKQHLARYLEALVTNPFDAKMVQYLNFIGGMHTPNHGNPYIDVPLVQINALMGFVADAFQTAIFSLNLDRETEVRTMRAFNKLLWIQNDLFSRHYARVPDIEEVLQTA